MIQVGDFLKQEFRLIFHNTELTDSVIDMDLRIPQGIYRHKPLVVVAAVGAVDYSLMIRLNNPEILKGRTSWYYMSLIALRKFHGNTQGNQPEFSLFQADILCGTQIDPVGLTVYISQFVYFVRKIFYFNRFQFIILFYWQVNRRLPC